jgi:hypothetical protein
VTEPIVRSLELNEGQIAIVDDVISRIIVAEGGYRGGKTFGLACKALDLARRNHKPVVFGAPTWPMVEQVFIDTLRDVCSLMSIAFSWNAAQKTATVYRRHPRRIICRSLDNPRSAEGLTSSSAIVDEWELCHPQAIKTINARITAGNVTQLVLGGTPEGFGPAYDLILKSPQPSTTIIKLPTSGNAHNLREDYLDSQRSVLDEQEQAEKLDGIRQQKGGLVYRRLHRPTTFGSRCIHQDEMVDLEMWCDFNVGAQCWYLVEVDRATRRYHVVLEMVGYDVDTDQHASRVPGLIADYMTRRYRRRTTSDDVRRMHLRAPCDASGRNRGALESHTRVLTSHGFKPMYASSGNPDVEDRVLAVNVALGQRRLTIDEASCPFLARALTQQGRDPSGAPAKNKDPRNDLSGPVDAIGYGVFWHSPVWRYRPNAVEDPREKYERQQRDREELLADVIR